MATTRERIYHGIKKTARAVSTGAKYAGRGLEKTADFSAKGARKIIDYAAEKGINMMMEHHPSFREIQEGLSKDVNKRQLGKLAKEIYGSLRRHDLTEEQTMNYLQRELSDYVSSGRFLNRDGQRSVLRKSLEEKADSGFFSGIFARKALKGEEDFDKASAASRELINLFGKGDYARRMPEISEAVTTVYDMGFLNSTIDVLKYYGLMTSGRYLMLKNQIRKRAKKEYGKMEDYISQKIAAAVFGILGFGILVLFGARMTGGFIGTSESNIAGAVAGGMLVIFSLITFARSFKN